MITACPMTSVTESSIFRFWFDISMFACENSSSLLAFTASRDFLKSSRRFPASLYKPSTASLNSSQSGKIAVSTYWPLPHLAFTLTSSLLMRTCINRRDCSLSSIRVKAGSNGTSHLVMSMAHSIISFNRRSFLSRISFASSSCLRWFSWSLLVLISVKVAIASISVPQATSELDRSLKPDIGYITPRITSNKGIEPYRTCLSFIPTLYQKGAPMIKARFGKSQYLSKQRNTCSSI